ncbi:MAG: prephenate dehydratase [Bacteroidota bacterium]|nr:prephenate dehydratase [Bacteroidota bacterium]
MLKLKVYKKNLTKRPGKTRGAFLFYRVMKISIQGIKGAFHEKAARNYFKKDIRIIPNITFEEVISSVISGAADFGIVAIENTLSGTIHSNLNLIRQSELNIVGEEYLPIHQNLIATPGTNIGDIEQVYSHYMAINQCRIFFQKYPQIKLVESEDTALSIRTIANKKIKNVAAIGSKLAADYYGMEILVHNIETHKNNYTRFLILGKKLKNRNFNKASLAFTLAHRKGSLANILNIIAFNEINLTKIESVPIIGEPWHYLFYVDVQLNKPALYFQMLNTVKTLTENLIVLGHYQSEIQLFNQIHNVQYETSKQNFKC